MSKGLQLRRTALTMGLGACMSALIGFGGLACTGTEDAGSGPTSSTTSTQPGPQSVGDVKRIFKEHGLELMSVLALEDNSGPVKVLFPTFDESESWQFAVVVFRDEAAADHTRAKPKQVIGELPDETATGNLLVRSRNNVVVFYRRHVANERLAEVVAALDDV